MAPQGGFFGAKLGLDTGPLASLASGFFGGFRAEGGPVMAGHSYIVGEEGPEVFRPAASGEIIPAHGVGGGGIVNNFNIQTPDADSFRRSQGQILLRTQTAMSRASRRNG